MHISSEESRMDPDSGTQLPLSAPGELWALVRRNLQERLLLLLCFFF